MCATVMGPDGTEYGSVARLRSVGFVIMPDDRDPDDDDDESCLCGVDIEAIVRRSGVPYELDPVFSSITLGALPTDPNPARSET